MIWRPCLLTTCCLIALDVRAGELRLVTHGQETLTIIAPGENEWVGRRLSDRILQWTGVALPVISKTDGSLPSGDAILVGTVQTNAFVRELLPADSVSGLGDEGFVLRVSPWGKHRALIATGRT